MLPWIVLGLCLTATAAVTWSIYESSKARDRARFANAVQAAEDRISLRLEIYVNVLRGGAALGAALDRIPTREEFRRHSERLRVRTVYPGIQGIGLSVRVPPEEKESFEARMRLEHGDEFRIWPDTARDEYHAIIFLEPLDRRNRAALGYDMYSEPTRRAAMGAARDSGFRRASGKVTLVQEVAPATQPGFLIYLPLYRGGNVPATVEERRAGLIGFAYAPFRAFDLFEGMFGSEQIPRIDLAIYDGEEPVPSALLYDSGRERAARRSMLSETLPFDAAGQMWTIHYRTRPEFEAGSTRRFAAPVGAAGTLFSFLLFFIVRDQQSARAVAEAAAESLRESEAKLRTNSEILETLNRLGRIISAELNLAKLAQALTDAATRLIGARFGAFFHAASEQTEESYTLLAVSGIPPEALAPAEPVRRDELFGASRPVEIVRLDDVTTDPQYARTMVPRQLAGMPVTSYLVVPVFSRSGELVAGLFFGHDRGAAFDERHERIAGGLARQSAIAIDNATLYQEAQQANHAKDEFLAVLSHELRTPMTAILGWSRLLSMGELEPDAVREAADAIHRSGVAQAQLIDDVLDISAVVTGNLRLRVRDADVNDIIRHAAETVHHAAESKGVRIETRLAESPVTFRADPARLQQVFWNLLANAIRFTPAGGIVTVDVERLDTTVRIAVRDNGQGITPEFLPHVFERFRQQDSSVTREHGGLGLGLAIVRYLVELHGGTVKAESEGPGRGATFIVELPIGAPTQPRSAPGGETDAISDPRIPTRSSRL